MGGEQLMATIPSPATWATGQTPTATDLNTELRDNWGFFANPPRVKVYKSTAIAVTGDTLMTWDTEIYDTDGMWSSGANSRLIAKTAGVYQVELHINWQLINNASPGSRYAAVKLNAAGDSDLDLNLGFQYACDAVRIANSDGSGIPQSSHCSAQILMAVNDYVEAVCGTDFNVNSIVAGAANRTFFGMRWIGTS